MSNFLILRWASVCILTMFVFGSVSTALAEEGAEEGISVDLNTDFFSKYIWRGQLLTDDWVFQPSIDVGYKTLSLSIWGNMDLTNYNNQDGEFSEIDYTLEHSDKLPPIGEIKGLNYSLGAIHYTTHGNDCPDMTELFWGLGFDCLLNPSMKVYHDTDKAERTYLLFSVGHSFEKMAEISGMPVGMEIGASLGWGSRHYNSYYWEIENSGLNDLAISVSFPVEIADGWTFTPSVNYVNLVNSKIRESDAYSTESDFFVAGISLSKSF